MTQSDKGKSSTGKPRTGGVVSTNLVIRDGNEMWYSSITDKPMINKLIELGMFLSTISHSNAKKSSRRGVQACGGQGSLVVCTG